MIAWIKELFHLHKWVIIKNGSVTVYCEDRRKTVRVGEWYTLQCSICGKLKRKELTT